MRSLTVDKLSKRYWIGAKMPRELWALREVSFTLDKGEILGIIGPNGAGKTTLLKVLSRVTPPTEGRVDGVGRVIPLLALGTGFQPNLSGRANIYLNAAIYGVAQADVDKRLDEIIEFSGIGEFMDVPVRRYSSGMYLRLAFSVAINMNPDILLADEVLAVGDLDFQERCLERVKQAGRSGMSVLFVSHDMPSITRLCDRVLWLNAGEVMQIGPPDDVVNAYQNSAWAATGRKTRDKRKGSQQNEIGEILFVALTAADGREVGAVKASDEATIAIGIEVLEAPLTLKCMFSLHAHGMLVLRSRSEPLEVTAPGRYIAKICIPPNLLAETVYSVNVDVAGHRPDGQKLPLAAFNALSFRVFDPENERRDQTGGVVAPKLKWTFSQKHSPGSSRA
jgi:lipopolysaccharide transport system ATP-binding protein